MNTLMPEETEEETEAPVAIIAEDECVEDTGNGEGNGAPLDEDSPYFEDAPRRGGRISSDDIFEPHIDYLCPQCGKEFIEKKHWRAHVVMAHNMNDLTKLNFEMINERQLKCTECDKIITNAYGIQNAQQHRITHLPFKAYARCRKCHKSYTDRKGLVKHLATYHRVGWPQKPGGPGPPAPILTPAKQPRKQIVTVANETYEIIYLDDVEQGSMEEETEEETEAPVAIIAEDECVEDTGNGEGNGAPLDEDSPYFEDAPRRGGRISSDDIFEPHIDYLCPQCGKEFIEKKHWRAHVVMAHNMNDLTKLNFEMINERQLKCTECDKIITNAYGIQNAQQHRITHLPFKAYARCRKCHKRIAMHSRENLLKHKFTHLPFRCTKCYICKREYKYR